jgi:hypothetical protein
MPRKFTFVIVTFVIVVLSIELQSWIFTTIAMWRGNLHFFPADFFAKVTDQQLARSSRLGQFGWPDNDVPRHAPTLSPDRGRCGSAFGDSLTRSAEVGDEEAWVHLLSQRLGCVVANYGVNAYGLDQAVLRYERIAPEGKVVIVGLYIEMLRRQMAASWTFYLGSEPPVYSNIKPYFTVEGEDLRLHLIPNPLTRESIATHHSHDYFMQRIWTPVKFPYTLPALRAAYVSVARADGYDEFWSEAHRSGSGILARRLISRLIRAAQGHNSRVVLVLMTHVDRLETEISHYKQFGDDMRRQGDLCVIDTQTKLREQARLRGWQALAAPHKHYNALGNAIIAEAVAEGLTRCGMSP